MLRRALAILAFLLVAATPVQAATINYIEDNTTPLAVPGLTGFQTTGSMMDGLAVTACFTGNLGCQTVNWADLGPPGAGGVSGTGWGLSLTGDTFTADWEFEISDADLGQLVSVLLDGRLALTLFDRTEPSTGTPGSAQGLDFSTALNDGTVIDVTYINPTNITGNAAVGDLFQQVLIEFLDLTGPRVDWSFVQDTDNDSRFVVKVPEPTTLMLLGLGMLALMRVPRRR